MDWNYLVSLIGRFFADPRVLTILGMILLDVVLAISAAIKLKEFDWKRLPEFYQTMVLPYVLGYLAAYTASFLIIGDWAGGLPVEIIVTILWSAIVGNLGASIIGHLKGLALDIPK